MQLPITPTDAMPMNTDFSAPIRLSEAKGFAAANALPERFATIDELDEFMSRPSAALVADLAAVPGDIAIVGVGGKMGPTVARMAKRACPDRRVIGIARFSEPGLETYLTRHGIETHKADLLDRDAIAALPRAPNVIFMAGRKFGSTGNEDATWAMNAYVPGLVAEHFAGIAFAIRESPFFQHAKAWEQTQLQAFSASRDGTIWVANAGSLDHIKDGTISSIRATNGLPGHQVSYLLEDRAGRLWVGVDDGLYLLENGRFPPPTRTT